MKVARGGGGAIGGESELLDSENSSKVFQICRSLKKQTFSTVAIRVDRGGRIISFGILNVVMLNVISIDCQIQMIITYSNQKKSNSTYNSIAKFSGDIFPSQSKGDTWLLLLMLLPDKNGVCHLIG